MPTYHIHIEGQVQGVGFRPYVYRLAKALGVVGTVSNGLDGVHILFDGAGLHAREFYNLLIKNAPLRARILRHSFKEAEAKNFQSFEIIESSDEGKVNLLLTPDLGLCDDCRYELHDKKDRRFHYPFITCINCGPRYSIMRSIPYDRERTSMERFKMCNPCQEEYNSPLTRRHFSQTNSCPNCPVHLNRIDNNCENRELTNATEIQDIKSIQLALEDGKILAIKGIGGYLLICDATNSTAVSFLRKRKHRPSKPFALMYPDLETLEADALLSEHEKKEFLSIESPIVLCRLRSKPLSGIYVQGICNELKRIGVMQAYTPLFDLILSGFRKPIVATSGNLSGSPIFFDDDKAVKNLGQFVDIFVVNDRQIVVPQDDSVVQYSHNHQQRIVLRRSRGFAPTFIHSNFQQWEDIVLGMGGDLKSAFALQHAGNTYISQYLGDLKSYDTQENFELTLQHLMRVLNSSPEKILLDKHPAYFSSTLGQELATKLNIATEAYQHHEAHFAAVLAENELLESSEPVLGVIWDGLGWGEPELHNASVQLWGGEFFKFINQGFSRLAHFDYFHYLLGDKMSLKPGLSALAICHTLPEAMNKLSSFFSPKELALYRKMLKQPSAIQTSSVGRLFDAAAALLLGIGQITFEGEAAMKLEALASEFGQNPKQTASFQIEASLNPTYILQQILQGLQKGIDKSELAFQFHHCLARLIGEIAEQQRIKKLAFSGGVFQNALLVDLIIEELGQKFDLYFHKELSPNDECISYGQLVLHYLTQKRMEATNQK